MTSKASDAGDGDERCRLRNLAASNGIFSRGEPASVSKPLPLAQATAKLQGRDIVRKGTQRKSRFLLAFPGLLGVKGNGGGRIGELAGIGGRNPVLYMEFPQGRMKLFGTHVYPKNKYLTLQLARSTKGVICEDVFESLIVFSEAWWIGTKEENPNELRLDFPENLNNSEVAAEIDFKGGAGALTQDADKKIDRADTNQFPSENEEDKISEGLNCSAENSLKSWQEATPIRKSARNAAKIQKYTDVSSPEDSVSSDDDGKPLRALYKSIEVDTGTSSNLEDMEKGQDKIKPVSSMRDSKDDVPGNVVVRGSQRTTQRLEAEEPLVQTTLSSLFKKAEDRKRKTSSSNASPNAKGNPTKRQQANSKETIKKSPAKGSKKGADNGGKAKESCSQRRKKIEVADDDIEDISSSSNQGPSDDDDDDDWAM